MAKIESRPALGQDKLRDGAKRVDYEFEMLQKAADMWRDHGLETYSRANRYERRMVTEVFLLHARNLFDFVAPRRGPHENDVLARDYVRAWKTAEDRSIAGRSISDWRQPIDRLLAHVTYDRGKQKAKLGRPQWRVSAIYEDLTEVLFEFLASLDEPRRQWFGPHLIAEFTHTERMDGAVGAAVGLVR